MLQELQSIADSSDKLKRNRGRRGLDMLKRMQTNPKVELQMHEANLPELRDVHKVDERLVVLAKALGARVVTNDFNLNKIAQLQGVEVINLNELANALKSVALPGESMTVRLVKPGDQIGQGVGYLDDGTMVVVEQGRSHIGQEVAITVTSVLQTPAGRMIFGRLGAAGHDRQLGGDAEAGHAVVVRPTRSREPCDARTRTRHPLVDCFRRSAFCRPSSIRLRPAVSAHARPAVATPPTSTWSSGSSPPAASTSTALEQLHAYYESTGDVERPQVGRDELLQLPPRPQAGVHHRPGRGRPRPAARPERRRRPTNSTARR